MAFSWNLPVCLPACLPVCLSVCLSACLLACLSIIKLSRELHASLSACLSVCLYVCLSVCLSICLSIIQLSCALHASLSACLSVCLSACLSVCLPICLSIYHSTAMWIACLSVGYSVYLSVDCLSKCRSVSFVSPNKTVSVSAFVALPDSVCLSACLKSNNGWRPLQRCLAKRQMEGKNERTNKGRDRLRVITVLIRTNCLFPPDVDKQSVGGRDLVPEDSHFSFIHSGYFYSASASPLLLRGAPDNSTDTLSELTHRSATGNCEWRTCPRSVRGG